MNGHAVHQRVRRRAGRLPGVQGEHGLLRRLPDLVPETVRRLLRRTRPDRLRPGHRRGLGDEQLASSGRYRSWMSYIRDFGRWLQAHGHADAYVLSDRWKAPFVPPTPTC